MQNSSSRNDVQKTKMEVRAVMKEDMKLKEIICMYVYVWKATQKTTKQKQKVYDKEKLFLIAKVE